MHIYSTHIFELGSGVGFAPKSDENFPGVGVSVDMIAKFSFIPAFDTHSIINDKYSRAYLKYASRFRIF